MVGSIRRSREFQNGGVVHDAVDGGCRGHRVLEDAIPLGEHEVGRDENALSLVALAEEGEEDLHLVAVLLDVADVVEEHCVKLVETSEFVVQPQIAPRRKKALDDAERRGEQYAVAAFDEFMPDGAEEMGLAAPG